MADLDRALYDERSLVKHLAMRRTLFVFPREILGPAQAGASQRVAGAERRRLVKEVEQTGLQKDGERWLSAASKQVLQRCRTAARPRRRSCARRSPRSRAR